MGLQSIHIPGYQDIFRGMYGGHKGVVILQDIRTYLGVCIGA